MEHISDELKFYDVMDERHAIVRKIEKLKGKIKDLEETSKRIDLHLLLRSALEQRDEHLRRNEQLKVVSQSMASEIGELEDEVERLERTIKGDPCLS